MNKLKSAETPWRNIRSCEIPLFGNIIMFSYQGRIQEKMPFLYIINLCTVNSSFHLNLQFIFWRRT